LADSRVLTWWLLFFCAIQLVLYAMKVPLVLKIVVALIAILLLPLLLLIAAGELVPH